MTLDTLLTESGIAAPVLAGGEVTGVTCDSRQAADGHVFVAIRGFAADGHDYLRDAAARGALCAVVERKVPGAPLPQVVVPDSRAALADIACAFYGNPTYGLTLAGITGTNGKTTTAYLVESVLAAAGHRAGLIGTVETRLNGEPLETGAEAAARTTPEASDLQSLFARMVRGGGTACVMEVSSHALELKRVRGCRFDVAAFTNLTPDHLDFHRTMEAYFEAKCKLFDGLPPGAAVVNVDDPWGSRLAERLERPVTCGLGPGTGATLVPHDLNSGPDGIRFTVRLGGAEVPVASPLVGGHNIHNLLAAVGVAAALGLPGRAITDGIAAAPPVPGRLERIDCGQPFTVLVDYAHTPDALARLLEAVRPLAEAAAPAEPPLSARGGAPAPTRKRPAGGRILTVFGCGGDRDTTKRAPMGEAAARASHRTFITTDNPRSEDPAAIAAQVAEGARRAGGAHEVVLDREEAIRRALTEARPGDVVLLAGKGHETYQVVGGETLPFDDREVARRVLRELAR